MPLLCKQDSVRNGGLRSIGDNSVADDNGNGWRGATENRIHELERRILVVETHPFICPQIKMVSDHEDRIRKLENIRWQIAGVVIVVQALGVGAILGAVRGWIK